MRKRLRKKANKKIKMLKIANLTIKREKTQHKILREYNSQPFIASVLCLQVITNTLITVKAIQRAPMKHKGKPGFKKGGI